MDLILCHTDKGMRNEAYAARLAREIQRVIDTHHISLAAPPVHSAYYDIERMAEAIAYEKERRLFESFQQTFI